MECLENVVHILLCYNDTMKCLLYGMTLKVETQEGNGRPSIDGPGTS